MGTVPRTHAIFVCVAMLATARVASAQSTMTINQPGTQVVFTTLRGGSYADTNQGADLETKTSSDMSVTRRALLKFDTTTIPVGTPIEEVEICVSVLMTKIVESDTHLLPTNN